MSDETLIKIKNKTFYFEKKFIEKIPFFSFMISNKDEIILSEDIDEETMEDFFNFYILETRNELNEKNIFSLLNNHPPEKIFKLIKFLDFIGKEDYLKFLENFIIFKVEKEEYEYLPIINNVEFNEEEREFIRSYLETKDLLDNDEIML